MLRRNRFLLATLGTALRGACVLTILLGVGIPHRAEAASGCRSDPIVILSDGIVLDVNAMIADDASDVKQIRYVLHVPDGSMVIRAISTDGVVGYKETFQVRSDSAPGIYTTEIQVKTGAKNVSVTATIAGGYASQIGITPAMVGLSSFTWTATTSVKTKGPPAPKEPKAPDAPKGPMGRDATKGPRGQTTLPGTMNAALAAWAGSAAWSAGTSAQGLTGDTIVAAVTL